MLVMVIHLSSSFSSSMGRHLTGKGNKEAVEWGQGLDSSYFNGKANATW